MSSNASAASGAGLVPRAGLGDVGGQQRLVAGAVEVDGIERDARVADREGEAVEAGGQLARDRVGDAAHDRLLGGRQQHRDRLRRARERRGHRAGGAGARGALGRREHPRAPVLLGGGEVVRADDDHRAARREVDPQLGAARDDVAAVGDLAAHDGAQEVRLRRLGGAVGRAEALDLGGDQRGDDAQEGRGRLPGAAAQPQAADHHVADPQVVHRDPRRVGHQRLLVRAGPRGDGQDGARSIDQHERCIERARGGTDDLGKP